MSGSDTKFSDCTDLADDADGDGPLTYVSNRCEAYNAARDPMTTENDTEVSMCSNKPTEAGSSGGDGQEYYVSQVCDRGSKTTH